MVSSLKYLFLIFPFKKKPDLAIKTAKGATLTHTFTVTYSYTHMTDEGYRRILVSTQR